MLSNTYTPIKPNENIGTKYFGIEIADFEYTLFVSTNDVGVISLYEPNISLTKNEALRIAKRILGNFLNTEFEAYFSSTVMHIDDIKDYMGNYVFSTIINSTQYSPRDVGWLIFFDPTPQINWEHKCIYVYSQ